MNRNITYETDEIGNFYKSNRISWQGLYPSEKKVFEKTVIKKHDRILDIGCGCGGLRNALRERYGIENYTGLDINLKAIQEGKKMNPKINLYCGDVLNFSEDQLGSFDIVVSLSCIDWNIEFHSMLDKAWSFLKNGKLILSIRLCKDEGIQDINNSYQYINFNGTNQGEIAPYNIFNTSEWLKTVKKLPNISEIYGYGYYGKPAKTAITKYKNVCFAVFMLSKSSESKTKLKENLELPLDLLNN